MPEIIAYSGLTRRPIFVPSVGHFAQGMLVCIPLFLDRLPGAPSGYEIAEAYREHYDGAPKHRRPCRASSAATLTAEALNDTDMLEIFVCANGDTTMRCWSPGWIISAKAPPAPRCRTSR